MSTAKAIVDKALTHITLNTELIPAEAYPQSVAFDELVDMLNDWVSLNIVVTGIQIPADIGDELSEPADAKSALISNLAVRAAPLLNSAVKGGTSGRAKKSYTQIQAKYMVQPQQRMPDTLPVGQGNQFFLDPAYFHTQEEETTTTTTTETFNTDLIDVFSSFTAGTGTNFVGYAAFGALNTGSIVVTNNSPYQDILLIGDSTGNNKFSLYISSATVLAQDAFEGLILLDSLGNMIANLRTADADSFQAFGTNHNWLWDGLQSLVDGQKYYFYFV